MTKKFPFLGMGFIGLFALMDPLAWDDEIAFFPDSMMNDGHADQVILIVFSTLLLLKPFKTAFYGSLRTLVL